MVAICASVTVIPAGIAPAIELRADMQPRAAVRRADEADDGVDVHQRRAGQFMAMRRW